MSDESSAPIECVDCGDLDAEMQVCPYAYDMRGDETLVALCRVCAYQRGQDV